MTSHGCKGKEPFSFMSKNPQFFKIHNTLLDQKPMIPVKFVKNHGDNLQNQALLKVPSGETWKVELRKCDGKVWLEKGWKEFADYYSVAHGDFLVFEYGGDSVFHVLIFDNTATEIEYPLSSRSTPKDGEFQRQDVEDSEDDKSVEILDYCSSFEKKRERSPLPSSHRRQKITKTDTIPETKGDLGGGIKISAKKGEDQRCLKKSETPTRRVKPLVKSENPFFSVVMQPSYVQDGCRLNIPYKFAEEYFKGKRGQVILRVSNGRAWTVEYGFNVSRGRPKCCFYSSWIAFVKDKNLKIGDVCVFELIKGIEFSLQVFIFRRNEEAANCRSLSLSQPEYGNSSVVYGYAPYPFFYVVMQKSFVDSHPMHVPKSFAEKYVKHKKQEMLLRVGDCSWPVILNYYPASGNGKLSAGWAAFARGNSLKTGDVCTFELIKSNVLRVSISRNSLQVFIFRRNEEAANCRTLSISLPEDGNSSVVYGYAPFPFFYVVMQKSLVDSYDMHVPKSFAEKYVKHKKQEMLLRVGDSSWPVILNYYPASRNGKLSAGWAVFARGNSLKTGDVCTFELIKSNVLRVSISRNSC